MLGVIVGIVTHQDAAHHLPGSTRQKSRGRPMLIERMLARIDRGVRFELQRRTPIGVATIHLPGKIYELIFLAATDDLFNCSGLARRTGKSRCNARHELAERLQAERKHGQTPSGPSESLRLELLEPKRGTLRSIMPLNSKLAHK
jgi:hypothetical protein